MYPLEHYTKGPAQKMRKKMRKMRKNANRIFPPPLGCDTDVDGVFGRRDGTGLRGLACGDARRLREGYLGEGGGEGDRTRPSLSIDVDMKV